MRGSFNRRQPLAKRTDSASNSSVAYASHCQRNVEKQTHCSINVTHQLPLCFEDVDARHFPAVVLYPLECMAVDMTPFVERLKMFYALLISFHASRRANLF